MKNLFIRTFCLAIFFFFYLSNLSFAQLKKYTDYDQAVSEAKKNDRDILIVLTGSEWCKPCIKMKNNVFAEKEFIDFANEKFIIFELNVIMPMDMNSENYKEYRYFTEKYQTNALPTLILLDNQENVKLQLGKNLTSLNKTMEHLKEAYKN